MLVCGAGCATGGRPRAIASARPCYSHTAAAACCGGGWRRRHCPRSRTAWHRRSTAAPPHLPTGDNDLPQEHKPMASALTALKWALAVTPSSAVDPRGDGGRGDDGGAAPGAATHEQLLREAEALVDMDQPLVPQIGKLTKAQYLAWVHTPYYFRGGVEARLFASPALERLTKSPWWVVPMLWLPVAAAFWAPYAASGAATAGGAALLAAAGLVYWSLLEYGLHRLVFHIDGALPPRAPVLMTLHFLAHGVHHRVPMDRNRLVMPPAAAAVIAAGVYTALHACLPPGLFGGEAQWTAFYGSALVGYVGYDMLHFSEHHVLGTPGSYFWRMKRYHMKHHYAPGDDGVIHGFGITSTAWDSVFGTLTADSPAGGAAGR